MKARGRDRPTWKETIVYDETDCVWIECECMLSRNEIDSETVIPTQIKQFLEDLQSFAENVIFSVNVSLCVRECVWNTEFAMTFFETSLKWGWVRLPNLCLLCSLSQTTWLFIAFVTQNPVHSTRLLCHALWRTRNWSNMYELWNELESWNVLHSSRRITRMPTTLAVYIFNLIFVLHSKRSREFSPTLIKTLFMCSIQCWLCYVAN